MTWDERAGILAGRMWEALRRRLLQAGQHLHMASKHRRGQAGQAGPTTPFAHPAVGTDGVQVEQAARGQQLKHVQRLAGELQWSTG